MIFSKRCHSGKAVGPNRTRCFERFATTANKTVCRQKSRCFCSLLLLVFGMVALKLSQYLTCVGAGCSYIQELEPNLDVEEKSIGTFVSC